MKLLTRDVQCCIYSQQHSKHQLLGARIIFTASVDGASNSTRGADILIDYALISVKLENGVIINVITFKFMVSIHTHQATRLQFPLRLAWGMTIYQSFSLKLIVFFYDRQILGAKIARKWYGDDCYVMMLRFKCLIFPHFWHKTQACHIHVFTHHYIIV